MDIEDATNMKDNISQNKVTPIRTTTTVDANNAI